MTEYLDPESAIAAARHLGFPIRDEGLLLSVARNHALFDGNMRFAWYLTLAFLRLNERRQHPTHLRQRGSDRGSCDAALTPTSLYGLFTPEVSTPPASRERDRW